MNPNNRDIQTPRAGNAFAGLLDDTAATCAAERLYQNHTDGFRFCSENRELLTAQEARTRDLRDAARRGATIRQELSGGTTRPQQADESTDPVNEPDLDDDDLEIEAAVDEDHLVELDEDDIAETSVDELSMLDELVEDVTL